MLKSNTNQNQFISFYGNTFLHVGELPGNQEISSDVYKEQVACYQCTPSVIWKHGHDWVFPRGPVR